MTAHPAGSLDDAAESARDGDRHTAGDTRASGPRAAGTRSAGDLGSVSDVELLHAHVAGSPDAFRELFHRHRDRLWAVALRTLADREEAADALQDALLSAHRAAARFRGDAAVTTWLHRIVINACLDRIRRRRAQPTVPLPDQRSGDEFGGWRAEPAAPMVDHDTVLVVRAALTQLPVEQRTAIVLVDLEGYPVAEVAQLLGVAEGTVKSRCARGRARLALLLGHHRPPGSPQVELPAVDPPAVDRLQAQDLPQAPGEPRVPGSRQVDLPSGNQSSDPSVPSGSRRDATGGRGGSQTRGQPAREQAATNAATNAMGQPAPEGGVR
jgi:RNA polymerase sigma-70 factor (ECF subfamily)